MGRFLGELSGFLMILLIATLFTKLLWDIKWIKKKETLLCFIRQSLFVVAIGLFYLFIGGMIFNYTMGQQVSIAEIETVWNYGNFETVLSGLEQGSSQGILNTIYVKIVHLMGTIFFKQYIACAIYISFIFTVLAVWVFFCTIKRLFNQQAAWYFITLGMVIPYAYHLFLPSPSSMVCLIAALIFYGIVRVGKFTLPDKVMTWEWHNFWTENVWLLTCILCGFALYQEIIAR